VEVKSERPVQDQSKPNARPSRPTNTIPITRQNTERYQTIAFLEKVQEQNVVIAKEAEQSKSKPKQPVKNVVNYIVIIDKSGSMSLGKPTRWARSAKVVATVTQSCCQHSPEGISVYFFGSPGALEVNENVLSSDEVLALFKAKKKLKGTTCLEGALAKGFQDHFAKKLTIPTSILVITDGFPDSKSAAKVENIDDFVNNSLATK